MSIFKDNSYSELIYRFMDGETDGVQQKLLFDALAKDSELQMEFQQAVSIVKGFNADKMALLPPAKLTNMVFQSAGFTAPMETLSPVGTNLVSKLSSFTVPVISAVAGAMMTVLVFFSLNTPNSTATNSNSPVFEINKNSQKSNLPSFAAMGVEKSDKSVNNFKKAKVQIADDESSDIVPVQSNIASLSQVEFSQDVQEPEQIVRLKSDENKVNNSVGTANYQIEVQEPKSMNMALEIRGIAGLTYFPGRTIMPEEYKISNNMAIGAMYRFNRHHSAGLIAGKESLQMYSFAKLGDNYSFNLEPSLFWAGANYRYTGDEFFASIHPFGEAALAGTQYGPFGKILFGLTYNPENFLTMSAGLEGSALMYRFLGSSKHTEKMSIVYNVGLNF